MRLRARKDRNHAELVTEFERLGAVVIDLSALGNGVPDVIVCLQNVCIPVECKDGDKAISRQKLTDHQKIWWDKARMNPKIVRNVAEAKETVDVLQTWVDAIWRGNAN